LRLYKRKGLCYLKEVKAFHEDIRADTLAKNVLTDVLKQQLIEDVRKLHIVPQKEAAVKLTEEEFTRITSVAQKYALKINQSSGPMFSYERR